MRYARMDVIVKNFKLLLISLFSGFIYSLSMIVPLQNIRNPQNWLFIVAGITLIFLLILVPAIVAVAATADS
jgi:hypothetical protein